eukprot:gnl/MRDRNA2_/MRDRNA2_90817_c0_seq1.p1 gnl/MRDRNA2_/MRDRNA2_90817_c0~~gnl/MRDRNA2_/MRDRNA2_90817_c0_seq1.p1  ORF type:complete len:385 (+),score=64.91 gnl/MRDRNA2_/MRDRNA2_90817_c0_seq1:55-1209(+)
MQPERLTSHEAKPMKNGVFKTLSEEMVCQRTRCGRIDLVKNLNLWGNELSDVSILREMPNLEVLSLSVNHLSSLKDLVHCSNLAELYLRKNDIADLGEVRHLGHLRKMRVVWLSDNPCATHPHYRQYIIQQLPELVKIDSQEITDEERRAALEIDFAGVPLRVDEFHAEVEGKSFEGQSFQEDEMPAPRPLIRRNSAPDPEEQPHRQMRVEDIEGRGPQGRGPYGQMPQGHRQMQPQHHLDLDDYGNSPPEARGHPETPPVVREALGRRYSGGGQEENPMSRGYAEDMGPNARGAKRTAWPIPQEETVGQHIGSQRADMSYHGEQAGQNRPRDFPERSRGERSCARSDNILCATLALIKELDYQGLELVRRSIEQRQDQLAQNM